MHSCYALSFFAISASHLSHANLGSKQSSAQCISNSEYVANCLNLPFSICGQPAKLHFHWTQFFQCSSRSFHKKSWPQLLHLACILFNYSITNLLGAVFHPPASSTFCLQNEQTILYFFLSLHFAQCSALQSGHSIKGSLTIWSLKT